MLIISFMELLSLIKRFLQSICRLSVSPRHKLTILLSLLRFSPDVPPFFMFLSIVFARRSILLHSDIQSSDKSCLHRLSYALPLTPLFSDTFQTMPRRRDLYADIRESCRAVPCTPDDFQESTTFLHSRHIPLTDRKSVV